jgi:hypothetical protein
MWKALLEHSVIKKNITAILEFLNT